MNLVLPEINLPVYKVTGRPIEEFGYIRRKKMLLVSVMKSANMMFSEWKLCSSVNDIASLAFQFRDNNPLIEVLNRSKSVLEWCCFKRFVGLLINA